MTIAVSIVIGRAMLRRSGARVLFVPGLFRGRDYPAEVSALLSAPAKPALAHVVVLNPPRSLPHDSAACPRRLSPAARMP